MDQRALVERAQHGDHDAFAELAHMHVSRLDAAARLILRDPDLARDAVQEGFIRAWRSLPALREPDAFGGWLRTLVTRSCLDMVRRRGRRADRGRARPRLTSWRCPTRVTALADRELLDTILRRLPPDARAVVVLHYYFDLTLPEVAATRRDPGRDREVAAEPGPRPDAVTPGRAGWRPRAGPRRAAGMTTFERFERDIPRLMDELAPSAPPRLHRRHAPGHRADRAAAGLALPRKVASHGRDRPRGARADRSRGARSSWSRSWRILLTAGLLVAGGSPQRLPAPFGPAANGSMFYHGDDGVIYAMDPVSGVVDAGRHPGPRPTRSRCRRATASGSSTTTSTGNASQLFVADADGANARPLGAIADRLVLGGVVAGRRRDRRHLAHRSDVRRCRSSRRTGRV